LMNFTCAMISAEGACEEMLATRRRSGIDVVVTIRNNGCLD
jgi:hypothetical protein